MSTPDKFTELLQQIQQYATDEDSISYIFNTTRAITKTLAFYLNEYTKRLWYNMTIEEKKEIYNLLRLWQDMDNIYDTYYPQATVDCTESIVKSNSLKELAKDYNTKYFEKDAIEQLWENMKKDPPTQLVEYAPLEVDVFDKLYKLRQLEETEGGTDNA